VGRVEHEGDDVPEVAGDPGGGLAAVVGGDPADDDLADALAAQPGVEVGGAVEGGADLLGDQQRRLEALEVLLERVAGLAREERALQARRRVLHVDQRPPGGRERLEQRRDVVVAGGVVARAPPRLVEALLHVDDDEGGIGSDHEGGAGALAGHEADASAAEPGDASPPGVYPRAEPGQGDRHG